MPRIITDQMDRQVSITDEPLRIVSLVPSQTELLSDFGLEDEVVGITKFCVHPEAWFEQKPRVGGTKSVHLEAIEALAPNLIIANKEENDKADILALQDRYPVWVSDIYTLEDALDMIRTLGLVTQRGAAAEQMAGQIERSFLKLETATAAQPPLRTAYLIWRKPFMAAAADTFIGDMLKRSGFKNVFAQHRRYPEFELDTLARLQPELILLSSEPYPFQEKHFAELQSACPSADIRLVDGEAFSWYGSRLLHSTDYFRQLQESLQQNAPKSNVRQSN